MYTDWREMLHNSIVVKKMLHHRTLVGWFVLSNVGIICCLEAYHATEYSLGKSSLLVFSEMTENNTCKE